MSSLPYTTIDEAGLNAGTVIAAGQAFVDRLSNVVGAPPNDAAGPQDPTKAERERSEILRLRSKGSDYIANENHWRFLMASYEGGPLYVNEGTLFKHQREHRRDYDDRLKRAHYQNYCQPLVDFVPEYIFSQGVERHPAKGLESQFGLFLKNCDRAGTSLDSFMQARGEDVRIFGMCHIQVDKLPVPEGEDPGEISVQRAADLGINAPYLIAINPLEVLKWQIDSRGNYLYLKRVEYLSDVDTFGNVTPLERYTEWTPKIHRVSVIDVSDRLNPSMRQWGAPEVNLLHLVPFVSAFYKRGKSNKDIGQSFLQDIAYQNRHIFNLTSLLDEFLFRQCFNMLVMPMRSQVPTKEQIEGDLGTNNVLEVPQDAVHKPEYISPPVAPAQFIQEERRETIQEMYRQAAQDLMQELSGNGRSQNSAQAQKQQFSRTIPVINKTADVLEFAENRIMDLWAKLQGELWTGKIAYKDDYSITNLLDLLLQLGMIFNTIKLQSPTFVREEWKRVIREFDSKLDPDAMDKILIEINAITDDQIMQMFANSQDVKATVSVPSTSNMLGGAVQENLASDKNISAATGSNAHVKEGTADKNHKATTGT